MSQMEYGQHTAKVKEVLDEIKCLSILSGGELPNNIDAKIINDLDEIPTFEYYDDFGDGRLTWEDIMALASSETFCIESELFSKDFPYDAFLEEQTNNLQSRLKNELPNMLLECSLHEIIPNDLVEIIHARLVMGTTNEFYETILKIYKSGGYPCGWDGKYPEGRLIVYYMKNK